MKQMSLAAAVLAGCLSNTAVRAADAKACEQEMARAAHANSVPLNVLYAVGLTETGAKSGFNPFDMNVDGRSLHPASLPEALAAFQSELSQGARFIDIGCMQINYQWHRKDFSSVAAMFNPTNNVQYAAGFLQRLRGSEGSWTMAVARYNAGPNNDAGQKKYVCQVIRNMVASGLGRWTPAAWAFCQ